MGNLRLRYRIPLAIIAILIMMTLFVGSSYALWQTTDYQESVNKIASGCFELSFVEDKKSIQLDNTYPMEDASGLKTVPYRFTIKNTCTIDANYTIYLNTLKPSVGTKLVDNLVKVSLMKEGGATNIVRLLSGVDTNTDLTNFDYDIKDETGNVITKRDILTSYILGEGTLKGQTDTTDGESATYDLRIWIDASATKEISGQTFEAAVASVAYAASLPS